MGNPKSRGNWNMSMDSCFPDCECFTCRRIKRDKEERKRRKDRKAKRAI